MRSMEEKILTEGQVLPGGILKVGSFLNQQIDTAFLREIGAEIAELFRDAGVNKILTVESSGISIAIACGLEMDVPVVFAKKHKTSNVDGSVYEARVHSFTHNDDYLMMVSRDYVGLDDRILIVDDFLANGQAVLGLLDLLNQAGSQVAGVAVAIEKCFQGGGDTVRNMGYRVESLAAIESMSEDEIVFKR